MAFSRQGLRDRWLKDDFEACEALAQDADVVLQLATKGLAACCQAVRVVPHEVVEVVLLGQNPHDWSRGHAVFDAVRDLTLKVDSGEVELEQPIDRLLQVAEVSAKVLYNRTDPWDHFDTDSGAWLFIVILDFMRQLPSRDAARILRVVDGAIGWPEASS